MERDETQPFLGLCMIVRDASKTIDALLDSIEGAFDEIVIVDTGSVDDTRDRIAKRITGKPADFWPLIAPDESDGVVYYRRDSRLAHRDLMPPAMTLASFRWIDDFAAARNYAFGLGTARWRGYLDADDTLPNAKNLRPTIRRTEKVSPNSNVIVLPYDYSEGEMMQDKFRFMRWDDGWRWEDEIHEHIERWPRAPRVISRYDDLVVIHNHSDEHTLAALNRNTQICAAVRERALHAGDARKAAMMAYYLGLYQTARDSDEAFALFAEAAAGLDDNNIACECRVQAARFALVKGKLDEALEWASSAAGRTPEEVIGHAVLGVVLVERGALERATLAFDRYFATKGRPMETSRDVVFLDYTVPLAACRAYVALGRIADAQAALAKLPGALTGHPKVRPDLIRTQVGLMRAIGMQRLTDYVEYLLWDTEPLKARRLLREFMPAAIEDQPRVAELERSIEAKLPQIGDGWEGYKRAYTSIPDAQFHTASQYADGVRLLGRARALVAWARGLAPTGKPVEVLSIGFQDGIIEGDMLRANSRIMLTVCDVSPKASKGFQALETEFPGRVASREVSESPYDWGERQYDAVIFFEVLEHVPSAGRALEEIHRLLRDDGILFLSTPEASHWVEPYLTGPNGPPWYGHVRAFSPGHLVETLRFENLLGPGTRIDATEHGAIFLAQATKSTARWPAGPRRENRVSILVPNTPHPFDPDSHLHGHLGGSEEAVIYLSRALAAKGWGVTVYSPRPQRETVTHYRDGVLWRDASEFDFGGDHGTALLWRCPQLVQTKAQFKQVLWLHDTHYNAGRYPYEWADAVVVLSRFHEQILRRREELEPGEVDFRQATNGIDLALYPPLCSTDEASRRLHHVVYGSSPDRGLARLLECWPLIRKEVPDATLDIFYTWQLLDAAMARDASLHAEYGGLEGQARSMGSLGVTVRGGVDHATLAREYRTAGIWAYPTSFEEISCITAMKAAAAGCTPIVTAAGALEETLFGEVFDRWEDLGDGLKETFARLVVGHMKRPETFMSRFARSSRAREAYGWDAVAVRFIEILRGLS